MKNGLRNTYRCSSTFLLEKNYRFLIRLKSTQTSADVSSLLGNGDINPKEREKCFFKRPWSGLLLIQSKIDGTSVGLRKQCTASWGISEQHNCQAGGPAKHRHKMRHLWLEVWMWCGWMCTERGTKDLSTSTQAVAGRGSNSSLIPSAGGGMQKAVVTSGSQPACRGDIHLVKLGSALSSKKKPCHHFPEV